MRFTEQMAGFATQGCPAYDAGFHTGRRDGTGLGFRLTLSSDDVAALLRDPEHRMTATGTVTCKALGPAPMPVQTATFDLFAPGGAARRLLMRYDLPFVATCGPMRLLGVKHVGDDAGLDLWRDTTTLFTRVLRADGSEYSRGVLRLDAAMFTRQLTTFRGRPRDVARFGAFFTRSLGDVYLHRPWTR